MPSSGIGQAVSFFAKGRKKAATLPNPLWQALYVKQEIMELATYDKDGYEVESGEQLHMEAPETFYIPTIAERENLKVGDCVKLVFRMLQPNQDNISVERMWVEITDIQNGFYIGFLDNDPVGDVLVKANDIIVFQPKHVIAIYE